MIDLLADHHVHSTFSDGRHDLATNIATAEALGLHTLGCVDHVRHDTDWLPAYVTAVARARFRTHLTLFCGVEAKLLDAHGTLDVPSDLTGVDRIYVADHQLPWGDGVLTPRQGRELISGGVATRCVVEAVVNATARAVARCPRAAVVAHLFSVLPKLGISEDEVDLRQLDPLIEAVLRAGAAVEVDERWACPSPRVARHLAEAGVPLLASSDAHDARAIGRYPWLSEAFA